MENGKISHGGFDMKKHLILVIDGQGGGIGKQLTQNIKESFPDVTVRAVGTNVMATQAMLKAGADEGATGENALITACKRAEMIVGPIGIVISDSLMGEITPAMAAAVGQSEAIRILLPVNQCDNYIIGVENFSISFQVRSCIEFIRRKLSEIE